MTAVFQQDTSKNPPKRVFFAALVFVFFCTVSAADSVGFVPCYIDGSPCATAETSPGTVALSAFPLLGEYTDPVAVATPVPQGVLPERLKIPSIDLDLAIQNPDTRDTTALDALLQKGPARYVDSAKLRQEGNMILFAHSSHLPIVHNKMFQAFNKIPDLKAGDTITVDGGGSEYLYSVTSVRKADTSDTISLSAAGATKLTLVTCDTLTGKSARFILEADLIGVAQPGTL